jgi:hypothetical protein
MPVESAVVCREVGDVHSRAKDRGLTLEGRR